MTVTTALATRHRIARQLSRLTGLPPGRKTFTQIVRRRASCQMPDYTVSFTLPNGRSLRPQETFGIAGIDASSRGQITVTGKKRDWVIGQARKFLDHLGVARIEAVLHRADELPGPTVTGPIRRGWQRTVWIEARSPRYTETDEQGFTAMRTLPLFAS